MKRTGNLIYQIAELENLQLAFFKAQKGKEAKQEIIAYRHNLDANLHQLQNEILSGEINVGNYHFFTIFEPKERHICASLFPERVLHHALMNICHPVFEKQQIFDSYATRKNKGTYAALHRAEQFQKKYKWFLKLDIRKYFDSITHTILFTLLQQKIKDRNVLQIFKKIIESYSTTTNFQKLEQRGLPIGNLTSQYFANYYLSFADLYIQQKLGVLGYVRYMDDMVLWHNSKEKLTEIRDKIIVFLNNKLKLTLKIKILNKSEYGLSFLGYRVFPDKTKLNKRSKKRFIEKTTLYNNYLKTEKWTQTEYQLHILPLIAYTRYAETKGLRKKIFNEVGY